MTVILAESLAKELLSANSYLEKVQNMRYSAGLGEENGRKVFIDTACDFLAGKWEE